MRRTVRWCWRKVRALTKDILEERQRSVEDEGESPTGWG